MNKYKYWHSCLVLSEQLLKGEKQINYTEVKSLSKLIHYSFDWPELNVSYTIKNEISREQIYYDYYPFLNFSLLIASTNKGVCFWGIVPKGLEEKAKQELLHNFPCSFIENKPTLAQQNLMDVLISDNCSNMSLSIHLLGTVFQIETWKHLLNTKSGTVVSYKDLAIEMGRPKACRAVGNAVGKNPVPLFIPCHRVIPKSKKIGGFRWGSKVKIMFLLGE